MTNIQVYLLLSLSFLIGSLFGTIFGIVDVEDYSNNKLVLYTVLSQQISFCEPIGAVFGGFAGFMLEFLRCQEMANRVQEPISRHFADSDEEEEDTDDSESRCSNSTWKKMSKKNNMPIIDELNTESEADEEEEEELESLIKI